MDWTRWGLVAAKSAFAAPPSIKPASTGRSDPTASRMRRRSAARVSRFGGGTFLLDGPVPRRSWSIRRAKEGCSKTMARRPGLPHHIDVAGEVESPDDSTGRRRAFVEGALREPAPHGEPAVSSMRTLTRHATATTHPARRRPEPLTSGKFHFDVSPVDNGTPSPSRVHSKKLLAVVRGARQGHRD
jgi:hypothetical protein